MERHLLRYLKAYREACKRRVGVRNSRQWWRAVSDLWTMALLRHKKGKAEVVDGAEGGEGGKKLVKK